MSFVEDVDRNGAGAVVPTKKECSLEGAEIESLDVIPRATGSALSILVTNLDGNAFVFNGDLSKRSNLGRPMSENSEQYEVESAATIATDVCRKGLLKSREDVLATLGQFGDSSTLQWRVIRVGTARHFQLLALNLSRLDGLQNVNCKPAVLMTHQLPSKTGARKDRGYHELHAPSGTLYELAGGRLDVYDLSHAVLKHVTHIGGRSAPVSSFSRLSSNLLLAVGGGTGTIYETKYGSVQSSVSLATSAESRKRKHDEIDSELGRFNLVASFLELGQAVGICGSELMVLQFSVEMLSRTRRKGHATTLVDVLGKGSVKEARSLLKAERRSEQWRQWTAKVDELASTNDLEGLESLVANDKTLGKQRRPHKLEDLDGSDGGVYDDVAAYEDLWPLPETLDPQHLNRSKVQYIMTKIFVQDGPGNGRLAIAIRSTKLVEWLALTGLLSAASLRKAFQSANRAPRPDDDVRSGDIMAAVREIDEDFQLLHDLLHLPVHWEVAEIVQALRIILDSFNTDAPTEQQLALPAPSTTNGDGHMPNGDANSELEVAENELDHAVNALTAGLEVRSDALRAIFARLHTLGPLDVTSTMRCMMLQEELFFLIHILRIELADGGWTSRYIDSGQIESGQEGMVDALVGIEESGPNDESIKVIAFLLNCAVDAIGVSAWLVGLGSNWSAKDLVESLRAEVSAGYEGCLEANYVKAFLADVEKYAAERGQQRSGSLHAEEGDEIVKAFLPIGGRASVPAIKGRNNNEGRKSKIAQAQEKSRNVGKYTFERIRI